MRRLITLVLSACLLVPALAAAQANSIPSQPHLVVRGKGERVVMPDRFRLSVVLSQTDMSPDAARSRVQADATAVLGLLKANAPVAGSVQASTLTISPEMRYVDGRSVFSGTQVQRSISATFPKIESVRAVLAGLKANEHVQVSGVTTAYSDETRLRGELKREAVEQTRSNAQSLANSYGVRLGDLYTISEVAPDFAYGIRAGSWGDGAREGGFAPPPAPMADTAAVTAEKLRAEAESLEAGSITLTEYVYAVFLIAS